MSDGVIIKTIYLKASPEKVWRFLTEREKLARWFHETSRDLNQPASFEYYRHDPDVEDRKLMWGEVLEVIPAKRLVHTFTHQWLEGIVTKVCWDLLEVEGGTQLTMTHSGLPGLEQLSGHDKGWDEHMSRLRTIIN